MIDWEQVEQLREDVGANDFREVVDLFLEEVGETVDRMRTSPDPAELESDLHFLKGSAANLGFETFAELCRKGEHSSAEGNPEAVDLPEIFQSFEKSRVAFLAGIRQ